MSRAGVQIFALDGRRTVALPVPPDATSIHDLHGDLPVGVYTALRTYEHNKFLSLEDHLARLAESAARLGWSFRPDEAALRRALHEVCSAYPLPEARIRLDVLARPISIPGGESRLLIALAPFEPPPAALYERGVRACLARDLKRPDPLVKNAEFIARRRQTLAADPACYEWLLVDERGRLLEGTTSNFYVVRDGTLWTASHGVLEGVARRIVLRAAAAEGIPVRLEALPLVDLAQATEAALSSASRAIVPVVQVEAQIIGDGRPGPIVAQLLAAYRAYVAAHLETAVPAEDTAATR